MTKHSHTSGLTFQVRHSYLIECLNQRRARNIKSRNSPIALNGRICQDRLGTEKTTRENTIGRTQTHTDRLALPALAYVFAYVFAYVSLLQTVRQSAQTYIVLCGLPEGKHTHLLRHFILKRIILARQAQDQHILY